MYDRGNMKQVSKNSALDIRADLGVVYEQPLCYTAC